MKRQASETDIRAPPTKHARITRQHPTGGNPSASQFEGIISRWKSFSTRLRKFAGETFTRVMEAPKTLDILPLYVSSYDISPEHAPRHRNKPPTPVPSPPRSETTRASDVSPTTTPPTSIRPPQLNNMSSQDVMRNTGDTQRLLPPVPSPASHNNLNSNLPPPRYSLLEPLVHSLQSLQSDPVPTKTYNASPTSLSSVPIPSPSRRPPEHRRSVSPDLALYGHSPSQAESWSGMRTNGEPQTRAVSSSTKPLPQLSDGKGSSAPPQSMLSMSARTRPVPTSLRKPSSTDSASSTPFESRQWTNPKRAINSIAGPSRPMLNGSAPRPTTHTVSTSGIISSYSQPSLPPPQHSGSRLTTTESNTSRSSTVIASSSATSIPSFSYHMKLDGKTHYTPSRAIGEAVNGIPRKYRNREHIYAKQHKDALKANRQKHFEELSKEFYNLKRAHGYTSDYSTFQGYIDYQAKLDLLGGHNKRLTSPSLVNLGSDSVAPDPQRRHSDELNLDFLARAIQKARETLDGPLPPKPLIPSFEELRLKTLAKDEAIERRLRPKRAPLPATLPREDEAAVDAFLAMKGVVAKFAREQVTDKDISRLKPRQWLNDEVVNFYGQLIMSRSEIPSLRGAGKEMPLNVHYFSTFFWSKLKGEGYEKGRLAKWTKKFDLFQKDLIIIPVNHDNTHWTCAAINFRRKRIESYDSMNLDHNQVYRLLRSYLDAEHRNKKKKPFDFTGWEDHTLPDTPQQENGYDCGVFTCQFLESISRGEETFNFHQRDIPYLRRKMIWEIGNAMLRRHP